MGDRDEQKTKPERKRPSRARRWTRAALILVAVVLVAGVALTRSPVMLRLVLPRIADAAGVTIDARGMYLAPDFDLVVKDAVVRVPSVDGPGGELLRFERLDAELDWLRAISGVRSGVVRSLELDQPKLRLSQSVETGTLNAAEIVAKGSGGSFDLSSLPTARIHAGTLELGEHRTANGSGKASFTPLETIAFSGLLAPSPEDGAGAHVFRVRAEDTDSNQPLAQGTPEILGRVGDDGVTIFLSGVTLDSWPARKVPTRLRPAYEALDLTGRIQPLQISVDPKGVVAVDIRVSGVALNLPFDPSDIEGIDRRDARALRMTDVTGEMSLGTAGLSAALTGRLDGVPYDVRFDAWGVEPTSPFLARLQAGPVRIERQDNLFRFTPSVVIDKLDMFVNPTARVTSTVWLRRGLPPPGQDRDRTAGLVLPRELAEPAGPVDTRILVAGELQLEDGVAAYRDFPYVFGDLSGRFAFDQERLTIENFRGTADTGATIAVDGWVGPLGDAAEVEIEVQVDNVPIDQHLISALDEDRQEMIEALFSSLQLKRLYEEGLVREPDAPIQDPDAPAPPFALGGTADVTVSLHRLYGLESVWRERIDIAIDDAGMLSEHFPIPLLGTGIKLTIEDDVATLSDGDFTTLRGGEVALWARAEVSEEGNNPPPEVRITATDVPIDDLLIKAIPGPGSLAEEEGPANLTSLLERLRLDGTLDCVADIGPHPDYGIGWDIVVEFDEVLARPNPRGDLAQDDRAANADSQHDIEELLLTDLTGTIRAKRDRIDLELAATAFSETAGLAATPRSLPDEPGPPPPTRVTMLAGVDLPVTDNGEYLTDITEPVVTTTAAAQNLDVELPVERLLSLFAPDFADRLAELRDAYRPSGRLDLTAVLTGRLGPELASSARIALTADRVARVEADTFGGRVRLTNAQGRVVLDTGGHPVISFEQVQADLAYDDDPAGQLWLTGVLPLEEIDPWPLLGQPAFPQLHARLTGARFESALTDAVVNDRLGGDIAAVYNDFDPTGRYDLTLDFTPRPPTPEERAAGDTDALLRADITGSLRPRSAAVTLTGGRLRVDSMDGRVAFTAAGGNFDELIGSGEGFVFRTTGDWRSTDTGAFRLAADLEASVDPSAGGIPEAVREALPDWAAEIADNLEMDATGGLELTEGRVIIERADPTEFPDAGTESLVKGDVAVKGGSLLVGLPVSNLDGTVRFETWLAGSEDARRVGWTIGVAADRLRVSGIRLTDARARIIGGREDGVVLIPDLAADAHGGRVAVSVRIDPPRPTEPATTPPRFRADVRAADVRLAPLLDDLALGIAPDPVELARLDNAPGPDGDRPAADSSRGTVDGDITVSGRLAQTTGLTGRGKLRASGGPVLALPLLTPLIEFSNLQAPVGERLDLAEASFYIEDETITFETMSVFSASVEIIGFGTMHWPTGIIDLRFRSEAVNRIPVLSGFVEAIRDELITTKLSGPVGEPEVSAETFPATRRLLGSLFGIPESDQASRLRTIERRAREERLRALRAIRRDARAAEQPQER